MRSVLAAILLAAVGVTPTVAAEPVPAVPVATIRVATFNSSLNRNTEQGLRRDLATPDSAQARAVAEIVQHVRPDILLLQEFDYDPAGIALAAFQSNYLGISQGGLEPIHFRHTFFTESNTGLPSGLDLDNDGRSEGGEDALGFGEFPGQYAMALLSRFPIDGKRARTFRKFLWRDMPRALLPDDPGTRQPADWYTQQELAVLPLSSKSHWDVPIRIGRLTLHVLASHPTPPAFDGDEDRNGRRNHDEIRFWNDYLSATAGSYIRDDRGGRGGLAGGAFVIMGDLNSDPMDGASIHGAIAALISHPRINSSFTPASAGAMEAGAKQGGANATHRSDPRFDTADFSDRVAGNLRVDYVLPSKGLKVCAGGVFWPESSDANAALVWGERQAPSSDHRLVWLDIIAGAGQCPPGNDPKASAASPRHR